MSEMMQAATSGGPGERKRYRPEQLVSVPEFAKEARVHPRTMRRKLHRIADAQRERGEEVLWLFRVGHPETGQIRISKRLLKAARPELFQSERAEPEDLDQLRVAYRELKRELKAEKAKYREFWKLAHGWFEKQVARTKEDKTGQVDP